MDLSLAHLKKVLKFGILLVGIQFAGLQSGLGEYTPSSLKGFTSNAIDNGDFCYSFWMQPLAEEYYYKSTALIRQAVVPSAMVDSNGDLYTVSLADLSSPKGIKFMIKKHIPSKLMDNYSKTTLRGASKYVDLYPWYMVNSSINCQTTPNLSVLPDVDPTHFKNYIYNTFQPCIAQEVGKYSDYLYVFCYIPPTRYMGISTDKDDEGILMLKIDKSSMSVVSQTFYPGGQNRDNYFSFNHQQPRRDNDKYAFGPEFGNYQAWVDTDDSGTDHVHLNWITLETANKFSTTRIYHLYNNNLYKYTEGIFTGKCLTLSPRKIKYKEYVYAYYGYNGGWCAITKNKRNPNSLYSIIDATLRSSMPFGSPFAFIFHGNSNSYNSYTTFNHDFCIVDNKDGSPIFCVLGLRATSESGTGTYVTSLSGTNNEHWKQNYFNESSKIVLILSNYTWDGLSDSYVDKDKIVEDPQNIIYSTGKTSAESCTTTCGCYSNIYDGYGDKQLFKNTHKLVAYTSESGTKYIIYCYCYPGKSKQLFLGYAPYIISNNKVQLLTKTEFKSPPTTTYPMGESFGNFTSCSRIISMDCKNGQLWITWMGAKKVNNSLVDDGQYNYFHIAAKDLVGE